jgi:hypothetical protein
VSSNLTTEIKLDKLIDFLEHIYGPNILGDKPEPQPPIIKPADGSYVIKPGGWGAGENPNGWKIVNMRDFPELFKVVDPADRNVATNFTTEAIAQQYIDYFKSTWEEEDDPQAGEPGVEDKPVEPSKPVTDGDGPYKMIGKEMQSTQRGPTTRHYASGKDDDKTIEKNVKDIRAKNYQFLVDVKLTTIEHNDTVSLKYGGTHMKSGWFDNTVDMESGQVGLGVEKKHPSADLEIIKGTKIGSILNKKIRLAGVYFKDQNKCEMWTNLGDGWKKGAEGTNVGKFNPKSEINEAQLRIDGFEDEPEISRAVVQEIEV